MMQIPSQIKANWEYQLFNGLIILLIAALYIWLSFFASPVECIYAKEGMQCKSCGLTRAFRQILGGDTTGLPFSFLLLFFFFLAQIPLRISFSIILWKKPTTASFLSKIDAILFATCVLTLFKFFVLDP